MGLTRTVGVDAPQFDFLRVLGIGGFGTVFQVQKKGGADDGQFYAMKVLKKAAITKKNSTKHIMTERHVLEAVRHHPFLTTLHYAFQSDSKLYLALDYVCCGDLFTLYHGKKLAEAEVKFYIGETILALEYLHSMGIIHRDVKMENILVDFDGHAILSDFGLSRIFLPHEKHRAYSMCGTPIYMAPEVLARSDAGYDMAVDWWSLGIVTYQLLIGQQSPFKRGSASETYDKLAFRIIAQEPHIPDDLSFDAADFISKLLDKDPRKRLGGGKDDAEELKRHPFLEYTNWSHLAEKKILPPLPPTKSNELDNKNFSEQLPATLLPDDDEQFRGYSYVSPSLCSEYVVSDEEFQPTEETCPNSLDVLCCQYTCRIEELEMELSEAKRVQMIYNKEKAWLESFRRAAMERIQSLETELIQANCVQMGYIEENRRLHRDLKISKKKITSLEVKLNEANSQWKRHNSKEGMLEKDLRATIKRIQSPEVELNEEKCAGKSCNLKNRKMESDLRAATERIKSLEAESTKEKWVHGATEDGNTPQKCHKNNKVPEAQLTGAKCAQKRRKSNKWRLKIDLRGAM